MKELTIKIPTSMNDVRFICKKRISKDFNVRSEAYWKLVACIREELERQSNFTGREILSTWSYTLKPHIDKYYYKVLGIDKP